MTKMKWSDRWRSVAGVMACCAVASCSAVPDTGNNAVSAANAMADALNEAAPATETETEGENRPQYLDKIAVLVTHGESPSPTRLIVELALTREQQERGLMHRTDLRRGEGMLFPFFPPRDVNFWMEGTPVSLDLIFIRPDSTIAKIVRQAPANDSTPLSAGESVAAVLELRGGDAGQLGIDEKDRISWGTCTQKANETASSATNFCPA